MFPATARGFAVAPAEDGAGVAEGGPAAGAEEIGGGAEDREGAARDAAGADEGWLAEQPATARPARTARTVAILTHCRRATPPAGARGCRPKPASGDPVTMHNASRQLLERAVSAITYRLRRARVTGSNPEVTNATLPGGGEA